MLIFRLLQIASLAYLCSFFKMASCHSLSVSLEKEAESLLQNSQDVIRTYKLYNQCSGRHVQIVDMAVNARGLSDSIHANISFKSVVHVRHSHAINIKAQNSEHYLCFNKKGKLIVRFNGKKQAPLLRRKVCLFKEGFSEEHFTVIRSLYDPTWYVGFNRKGKPLKGNLHSIKKHEKCFNFIKREHVYGLDANPPPSPIQIKNPWKLKDLLPPRPFGQRKTVPRTPIR
ncbi:fibroblast growth factor 8 [Parasteatoda tepidariorum]|uniref:fibroblast growth factor 8 n=1 Tax=Parasteatoda tepidariorum TaxID=114398 RepID=UPI00077F8E61|nr:fibroblast growth factor 8 [Parasteatoda tepidariorum]